MKKEKKFFLFSKEVIIWSCVLVAFLLFIIFLKPMREEYKIFNYWQQENQRLEENNEILRTWKDFREEWKMIHDENYLEKIYKKDAEESLGGDTPEETFDLLRKEFENNNIEKALLLTFKLWRENYKDLWGEYVKDKSLSNMIEDYSMERINCNYDNKELCLNGNDCLIIKESLLCEVGIEDKKEILFVKNLNDKWQIIEGLGL